MRTQAHAEERPCEDSERRRPSANPAGRPRRNWCLGFGLPASRIVTKYISVVRVVHLQESVTAPPGGVEEGFPAPFPRGESCPPLPPPTFTPARSSPRPGSQWTQADLPATQIKLHLKFLNWRNQVDFKEGPRQFFLLPRSQHNDYCVFSLLSPVLHDTLFNQSCLHTFTYACS